MAHFITADDETIYIEEEISFKMISPLKEKTNSYSFPFNIPITPETSLIFERAEITDAKNNKIRVLEGTMVMDIIPFIGVLRLTNINDKYKCSFIGQNRSYYILTKNKLPEIDLGIVEIPEFTGILKSDIEEFYFNVNNVKAFCFPPFENNKARDNYPFDDRGTNIYNHFMYHPNHAGGYAPAWFYVPAYFINFLIKHILNCLGFYVGYNVLDNAKFGNLFLLSDYILSNYDYTESEGDEYQWDIEEIIIDEENEKVILQLEEKSLVHLYLYDQIKIYDLNIEESYNYEGRILQIDEIDTINYLVTVDINYKEIKGYTGDVGKIRRVQKDIVLDAEHSMNKTLPSITPAEFITAIENLLGIVMIPSDSKNEINIYSLKDILLDDKYEDVSGHAGKIKEAELNTYDGFEIVFTGTKDDYYEERVKNINKDQNICNTVATKGDLPTTGNNNLDVRYVIDEGNYYIWNTANYGSRQLNSSTQIYLGSWMFFSEGFWMSDKGDSNLEIKIEAVPIVSGKGLYYSSSFKIPRLDIPLNSPVTTEYSETGIRVAFLNEITDTYPLAKTENDYISLKVNGEKGLYEQCYKEYIEWKLNRYRESNCSIYWPYHLLSAFPWQRKFRIKNTNYFALEINLRQKGSGRIVFDETLLARI